MEALSFLNILAVDCSSSRGIVREGRVDVRRNDTRTFDLSTYYVSREKVGRYAECTYLRRSITTKVSIILQPRDLQGLVRTCLTYADGGLRCGAGRHCALSNGAKAWIT
jgi:hypothetical protein